LECGHSAGGHGSFWWGIPLRASMREVCGHEKMARGWPLLGAPLQTLCKDIWAAMCGQLLGSRATRNCAQILFVRLCAGCSLRGFGIVHLKPLHKESSRPKESPVQEMVAAPCTIFLYAAHVVVHRSFCTGIRAPLEEMCTGPFSFGGCTGQQESGQPPALAQESLCTGFFGAPGGGPVQGRCGWWESSCTGPRNAPEMVHQDSFLHRPQKNTVHLGPCARNPLVHL
jgi:hypothetical protein